MILNSSEYEKLVNQLQNYAKKYHSGFFINIYISNYKILSHVISDAKDSLDQLISLIKEELKRYQSPFIKHLEDYIFIIIPQDNLDIKYKILRHLDNLITLYLCEDTNIHFCHKISMIPWQYNQNDASQIILSSFVESIKTPDSNFTHNDNLENVNYLKQYLLLNRKINHIKDIILNNKINFVFQPIVKTITNKIEYYECLMRVPDFEGENVKILDFIMIAEEFNLIHILDSMVFDIVANKIKNSNNIKFAINISNNNKTFDIIKEKIENEILDKDSASRLILEITETSNNQDYKKIKEFINLANKAGYKVAIDDFGVGYTSLNQLSKLPINIIKIDGAFIKDMHHNIKHRHIVEGIVNIAHKLGIKVVAEFVNDKEIVKILTDIKLDYMQGNFFSAPKKDI